MRKVCRPSGRLFYLLLAVMVLFGAAAKGQTSPSTTTVQDVVYRADGTPAQGTLLITWPDVYDDRWNRDCRGNEQCDAGTRMEHFQWNLCRT